MDVFDLMATISLNSDEYKKGLSDASQSTEKAGKSIGDKLKTAAKVGAAAIGTVTAAVGVVSTKMIGAVGDTAEYGDAIDKASQKLGISAKAYQEWDAVLQHSGTSIDSMGTSFKKLATASQNATADQVKAFEQLGLSMDEVSKMSAEDLFGNVINGLQGMEEGTERTALATTLLGKGAMELGPLLNTSAEDTQSMIDAVNKLGGVMSDDAVKASARYQDSLQDLKTVFSGAKNAMTAEFLPGIADVMDGLTSLFSGDSSGIQQISDGISSIAEKFNEVIPKISSIASELIPVIIDVITKGFPLLAEGALQIIQAITNGIQQNLPEIMKGATKILSMIVNTLISMMPQVVQMGIQIIVQLVTGLADALPELIPVMVDAIITIVDTLIDNVDMLVDAAIAITLALAEGLINALPRLLDKAPEIIEKLVTALVKNAPKLLSAAAQLIVTLVNGIVTNLPKILALPPKIITGILNGLKSGLIDMALFGGQLVVGLWNGISDKVGWIVNKIKGFGAKVLNSIKSVFGIHSPSRETAWIGDMLDQGLGNGISNNAKKVINQAQTMADNVLSVFDDMSANEIDLNSVGKMSVDTNSNNSIISLQAQLNGVMELLNQYLPEISNRKLYLESGALVGGLAPNMDAALGKQYRMEERYV